MKKIQKIIGVILVIVLLAVQLIPTISVNAEDAETVENVTITTYGENEDGINPNLVTNTATLTVNNVGNGDELSAYKIIDTFYDESTNEVTYDFTSDFRTFLEQNEDYGETFTIDKYFELTSDEPIGNCTNCTSVITTSTLNTLVSKYTTYLRNDDTITGIDMITTDAIATVEVIAGAYLILPKTTTNIYGVMVGNATFEVQDGSWVLNNPTIVSKRAGYSYYFASFMTTSQSVDDSMGEFFIERSYEINQTYTNVVGVNQVIYPTNAINTTFKFEIILDEGITFEGLSTVQVREGIDEDVLYTINEDGTIYNEDILIGNVTVEDQKLTFVFDTTKHDDSTVVLFNTKLNENANLGITGNRTTAKFIYASDPYSTGEEAYTTQESINVSYTYGLIIKNYGDEAKTKLINGSSFEVYSDSDLTNLVGEVTIFNGEATLFGVSDGTYYLKQTRVPTGYKLKNTMSFTVDSTSDYYTVEIINEKLGLLPTTGGIGTIIYTLIGLVIVGISTLGIVYYRKKKLMVN